MAFYQWDYHDHFKKRIPAKFIVRFGKKKWDLGIDYNNGATSAPEHHKTIFTMPSFARHGRWGNMVFQYVFIRILALNNEGQIQLYRKGNYLGKRMDLYEDMAQIEHIQTKSKTILLDNYGIFPTLSNYIPEHFWRAMYVSNVRLQDCFILRNYERAVNKTLALKNEPSIEVEGVFMINPKFYEKSHKQYILNNLFQPCAEFKNLINKCVENLGNEKTVIGIHIRRGDYLQNPLGNFAQYPISTKYILQWLNANFQLLENPVIYVCSDDQNAYKEIESAGYEVFTTSKICGEGEINNYEQLDWELLRRSHILLTSNSSFSFSTAFLSKKNPACYRFSIEQQSFVLFDPWDSEPLQAGGKGRFIWSYAYSRFLLVNEMAGIKAACFRLKKDLRDWLLGLLIRIFYLYFSFGLSLNYFTYLRLK
jgi:hypothetical protein